MNRTLDSAIRVCLIALAGATSVWLTQAAHAQAARELVEQGNAAYIEGKFNEALEYYEKATVETPESPRLYFNKGDVYFQLEDYEKAEEAYRQAALKSKDLELEAISNYNLGNCAFREAERQRDSDLQKALEALEKSVRCYQKALDLNPDLDDAAQNIEVARLTMKTILDEIKKRQEEAEKQQQACRNAMQQLDRIIEEQKNMRRQSRQLDEEGAQNQERMEQQAEQQERLRQDTQNLADQLSKMQQQAKDKQPAPAIEEARKNVEEATQDQTQASQQLRRQQPENAYDAQGKAVEKLEEAREQMKQSQQGQGGQKQQQQEQQRQDGAGQKQQQAKAQQQAGDKQEQKQGEQGKAEEKEKQEEMATALSESPEDIIDEEERQRRKALRAPTGYKPVEKDW